MEQKIRPFEYTKDKVEWVIRNCDTCVHSHTPKKNQRYGYLEMKRKVDKEEECPLKYAMHQSYLHNGLTEDVAKEMGFGHSQKPHICHVYMPKMEITPKPGSRNWWLNLIKS